MATLASLLPLIPSQSPYPTLLFKSLIATLPTSCYPALLPGIISLVICLLSSPGHTRTWAQRGRIPSVLFTVCLGSPVSRTANGTSVRAHTLQFWLQITFSSSQIPTSQGNRILFRKCHVEIDESSLETRDSGRTQTNLFMRDAFAQRGEKTP